MKVSENTQAMMKVLFNQAWDEGYEAGLKAQKVVASSVDSETVYPSKTEKRVAGIGEFILITNAQSSYSEYENGDVLEVVLVRDSGLSAKGIDVGILHDEYEVVINKTIEPIPAPLTANQQRAELIQRAREFKGNLIDKIDGYYRITGKRGIKYLCDAVFKHNHKKRTTTCILVGASTGYTRKKITVRCHPNEVFNEPIGELISLCKALEIDIPQEFLKAVQPRNVVVGMKIQLGDGRTLLLSESNPDPLYSTKKIIDDTNAIYGD